VAERVIGGGGLGGATALSFPKYMRLESLRPSSTALEKSWAIKEVKKMKCEEECRRSRMVNLHFGFIYNKKGKVEVSVGPSSSTRAGFPLEVRVSFYLLTRVLIACRQVER